MYQEHGDTAIESHWASVVPAEMGSHKSRFGEVEEATKSPEGSRLYS